MDDFVVIPVWDDEAKVWYTDGNIIGLNLEAETLEELIGLVREYAGEMIEANHSTATGTQIPAHAVKLSMEIGLVS